jgi:hypothetical protein
MNGNGTDDFIKDALRKDITEMLQQCTEQQRALWERIFPKGIEDADLAKLRSAHGLCLRTLAKNAREAEGRR